MIRKILVAAAAVSALAVVACKPAVQAPAEPAPVEAPTEPTQPVADQPVDQTGPQTGEDAADSSTTGGDATAAAEVPAAEKK